MEMNLDKALLTSRVICHKNEINILAHALIKILLDQVNEHDNSKLEEPEISLFSSNIAIFTNENEYLSVEYKELIKQIDEGIQHHYSKNRHHPEHFENGINDMNIIDILDMLFDWMASNKIYKNNFNEIEKMIKKQQDRFDIDPQLISILINTAKILVTE